jgi:hypothetical protein
MAKLLRTNDPFSSDAEFIIGNANMGFLRYMCCSADLTKKNKAET